MTFKKASKINSFILVDKTNRLLLYQRFKVLFFKKHLSNEMKK
ncbi:peptidase [Enterococcus faecalis]|nr:peptidase [Enterococcus faecalis]